MPSPIQPYRLTFVLDLFETSEKRAASERAMTWMVGALAEMDADFLRRRPSFPRIARAGVVYSPTPAGQEQLQDIPTCVSLGTVDGADLGAWRAAEIVVRDGIGARVRARCTSSLDSAPSEYVIEVVRADGRVESAGQAIGIWQRTTYGLDLFNGPHNRAASAVALDAMLRALTEIDVDFFASHPDAPRVRDTGVIYREEPPGQEDWQDWPTCLLMMFADCEDLSCATAAERRVRDRLRAWARSLPFPRPDGSVLYHIDDVVQLPNGAWRVEDPSVERGMR